MQQVWCMDMGRTPVLQVRERMVSLAGKLHLHHCDKRHWGFLRHGNHTLWRRFKTAWSQEAGRGGSSLLKP